MQLTVGPRSFDLTSRALVLGGGAAPDDLAGWPGRRYAVAGDAGALDAALSAPVALVHLPDPADPALRRCADAGVAVVVPAGAVERARAAGMAADRVVADTLVLDVTGAPCPVAATAVGIIRGARIVWAPDAGAARRVRDVLAAVMEAR